MWPRFCSPAWLAAYASGVAGWALLYARLGIVAFVCGLMLGLMAIVAIGEWIR